MSSADSREWKTYTRATAGLPSDTILALAPADSESAWSATAGGIYRFTPPNLVSEVRPGFSTPITDLASDSLGRRTDASPGPGAYFLPPASR